MALEAEVRRCRAVAVEGSGMVFRAGLEFRLADQTRTAELLEDMVVELSLTAVEEAEPAGDRRCPLLVKVAEPAAALKAREDAGDEPHSRGGTTLDQRFRETVAERGLSHRQLARIFGRSVATVSTWLRSPSPDDDGAGAIPTAAQPLIEAWLAAGTDAGSSEPGS
jgi:hypothetical protein